MHLLYAWPGPASCNCERNVLECRLKDGLSRRCLPFTVHTICYFAVQQSLRRATLLVGDRICASP